MELQFNYCFRGSTVLKWLEIVFSILIIALVQPCMYVWAAYGYLVFVGSFCLAVTFLLLILYFMEVHSTLCKTWPWRQIELLFDFVAVILCFIGFGIAVFDTVKMYDGNYSHHKHGLGPFDITYKEWRERMAATSAFLGMNGILYMFSGVLANQRFL